MSCCPCGLHKHERKLADLRETDSDPQRRLQPTAKHQHDSGPDHQLSGHNQDEHHGEQRKILENEVWVDQGADGDEKHGHKGIPE